MKAFVDEDACIGCGLCEAVCPRVFIMNDEGKAEAKPGELDAADTDDARDAESQCPVGAISTEK